MQVKTDGLQQAANAFSQMQGQLDNSVSQLGRFSSRYGDITSVAARLGEVQSVRQQLELQAGQFGQCGQVLKNVSDLYQNTERKIADYCDGMKQTFSYSTVYGAGQSIGNTESWGEWNLEDFLEANSDMLKIIKDPLSNVKELLDAADELFGTDEFLEEFKDLLDDMKGSKFLKVADYINKGKKLLEHWNKGDADAVEKDLTGFLKKGAKKLSGLSGTEGGVYLNWGVNMGKEFAEGMKNITEDPSIGTIAGTAWNATIGSYADALWESGSDLGATITKVAYGLVGAEFDQKDYDMAMDYLKGVIQDCTSGTVNMMLDTGSKMWQGAEMAASWFRNLF